MGTPGLSPQTSLAYAQCTKFQMTSFMQISLSTWLQQQRLGLGRESIGLKYFVEHTSNDDSEYSYFPGTGREWNSLPSDIVSAKSLEISIRCPSSSIYLFIFVFVFNFICHFLLNFKSFTS